MSIEHLLPQRWKDNWPVDTLQEQIERDNHVHRLGNLSLLTQYLNSSVSNGPWVGPKGKRASLEASDTLLMTRQPRRVDDWNESEIDARTADMTRALLETWPAPEGHNPDPVKRSEQDAAVWVMVRDLVATGFLEPGIVLTARTGNSMDCSATVTADGLLEIDGNTYDTPSGAGRAMLGRPVNGWAFWRMPDGAKLTDVRKKYLGTYVDRRSLYGSFWREVLGRIKEAAPDWTQATAPGDSSWITLPYGSSTAHYVLAFTLTGPAVDLEFRSPDEHENLRNYEKFGVHRQALEASFGQILSWEPLKTRKACRIRCSRPGGGQVIDEDGREELIEWFVTTSLRFRSCTQTIRADIQHPT